MRSAAWASGLLASQAFWVTVAVAAYLPRHDWLRGAAHLPDADNFFNITRNFAGIGIMALGMTAVIITGGIDLSVGSVMGVVGGRRRRCVLRGGLSGAGRAPDRASCSARSPARQRRPDRLCPAAALRGHAGHAVDRAFARDRAVGEPVIYQFGPGGDVFKVDRRRPDPLASRNSLWILPVPHAAGARGSSSTGPPGAATSSRSAATRTRRG